MQGHASRVLKRIWLLSTTGGSASSNASPTQLIYGTQVCLDALCSYGDREAAAFDGPSAGPVAPLPRGQRRGVSLARFGELSDECEPVMPKLSFAPATEELATEAAAMLSAGWCRQRASIDNLAVEPPARSPRYPEHPRQGLDLHGDPAGGGQASFTSPVIRGRWPEGPEGESPSRDVCLFQIMVFRIILGPSPSAPYDGAPPPYDGGGE
jgi:hypothetical protein